MQNKPLSVPWFEPSFDEDDIEAVRRVVASGFVNEGPENRQFEQELCAYFGVNHAVTTPSCTIALALALMARGIGHGDTVMVPAVTFIGSASAVRLTGAEVLLVDVNPHTFVIDVDNALRRMTPQVKAILPVHLTGRSADMPGILQMAKEHGIAVIEDAAEALASRNAFGWLGTQSDAGCFSLAPTKLITSGQGGFVLTNDQDMRDQLVRLRDHGRLSRASDLHPVVGFNFKVTDMQAALARSQWKKLDTRIERAREIDLRYTTGLADCPGIHFTERPSEGYLLWPDFKCAFRDDLVKDLLAEGIHLRPYWPALSLQPAYHSDESFPGAEEACHQACWLPCSPSITDETLDRVIERIRHVATRHAS